MIRELFLAGTGIQFHRSSFSGIGMDPKHLYPFVTPRPPGLEPTAELVKKMVKLAKHEKKIEVSIFSSPWFTTAKYESNLTGIMIAPRRRLYQGGPQEAQEQERRSTRRVG